jgi:DNA-binding NtrC family response regulator
MSPSAAPSNRKPPRRILVVDDEEPLRHMLRLILERAGYAVVGAADGQEGLEVLGSEPGISIVLCDLRMPRLDGMAFLEAARRTRPGLLVIMMSAYGNTDTAIEAVKRGAYDFVSKPFRADEIVLVLRKVEERESLARENATLRAEVALRQPVLEGSLGGPEDEMRSHEGRPRSVSGDLSIPDRVAALERVLIQEALLRTGGNRTRAARLLEISYKALVYKIRDYGLEA